MKKNFIFDAIFIVFKDIRFLFGGFVIAISFLGLNYFFFSKATTFDVFLQSNKPFYNWLSISLTILSAVFLGVSLALFSWQFKKQKTSDPAHFGNSAIASFLGVISSGCPICGSFLLSFFGIAGGLAAFPLQGLEIKTASLFLLGLSIFYSSKTISQKSCAVCEVSSDSGILKIENEDIVFSLNKGAVFGAVKKLAPAFLGFFLLYSVIYLPQLAQKYNFKISFQPPLKASAGVNGNLDFSSSQILEEIIPKDGYEIAAVYGNIGPRLLEIGAIDFEKMKSLYERSGQPLSEEQIKILKEGSNEKIKITRENSYFLLNFLWALGLTNKNPILDEGPMAKSGKDKIGYFASTGGWTLGEKPATELYSKFEIIPLNEQQQKTLEEFAYNSYRPCCSNPTGFPDCNHGMAALALGEIMVAQGALADEIFEAFKYFNAYWFTQTYFDVANYFKHKEGKDWNEVPARLIASAQYSTPQGWQKVKNWLLANNSSREIPIEGGRCGA